MYRDKDHIIILINQFKHLLRSVAIRNTNQAFDTADTMIGMDYIITGLKLLQFFHSKSHLTRPCLIATKIVFMETVEYLMIGEDTHLQRMIDETGMQSLLDRSESNVVSPIFENMSDTSRLFRTIATYIDMIPFLQIVIEELRYQFKILMKEWLRRSFERDCHFGSTSRMSAK